MKPSAIEELGVMLLGELGKVYQQVDALPENLKEKLAAVEGATQALMKATKEAQDYAGELQQTADKIVASSVETTKKQLVESIAITAKEVAYHTSKKSMLQWAAGCVLASVLGLLVFGYLLHSVGSEAGYQRGRSDTLAAKEYEKDACTWFNTQEGQMAIGLYEVGSLQDLYTCNNPGWVIAEQGGAQVCIPMPEGKNKPPKGWRLPVSKAPTPRKESN
jgi:hypothetical protein